RRRRLLLAMGLILGLVTVRTLFPGRAFDAVAWQADADDRGPMADRLVARGSLAGLTRGQVVDLLGEPPDTDYFRDWDLVYHLGMERGLFSIDSEWLLLKLGPDGHVAEVRINTD
ncbi:MAG: outer membrane protein assembly factor BamE, partial [Nannocystaceae bacterium]|nr:outer membrane protein assembly factor BamE [Nannocystaceae bacterium]